MLLRHLARPLLAVPFVYDGVSAALRPAPHVEVAEATLDQVGAFVPGVREATRGRVALVVRAHGALTAVAGLLLAVNKAPRTAALALAALTAPLAVAYQPVTREPGRRDERAGRFVKALGLTGAALLAAADTEGRPGVRWRVEHAREERHVRHAAVDDAVRSAVAHDA
ncbi:DoxX family membrane protein [Luteimicrobium sp. DT211]|uniref:DoxX family membrane protein n=1 Tax=Luteimicrobium sp. DT211 TaxID=3393412 RepID=UPI003CF93AF3